MRKGRRICPDENGRALQQEGFPLLRRAANQVRLRQRINDRRRVPNDRRHASARLETPAVQQAISKAGKTLRPGAWTHQTPAWESPDPRARLFSHRQVEARTPNRFSQPLRESPPRLNKDRFPPHSLEKALHWRTRQRNLRIRSRRTIAWPRRISAISSSPRSVMMICGSSSTS